MHPAAESARCKVAQRPRPADRRPLTLAYYRDRGLEAWVRRLGRTAGRSRVYLHFRLPWASTPSGCRCRPGAPRVLDLCDVDSDKWRQYAAGHGLPLNLVYGREARTLESLESRYVESFDATLVISDAEADILRGVAGQGADRIRVVPNGVDTDYFDPAQEFVNPFEPASLPIVFTGAMDYHANVDGVRWFADEIFPTVHSQQPTALFAIVGSNPTAEVTGLAATGGAGHWPGSRCAPLPGARGSRRGAIAPGARRAEQGARGPRDGAAGRGHRQCVAGHSSVRPMPVCASPRSRKSSRHVISELLARRTAGAAVDVTSCARATLGAHILPP